MRQQETMVTGKNRIMIYGPKTDGRYVVKFRTAASAGDLGAGWRDPRAQVLPGKGEPRRWRK
jgi:hypothetical protein